MNKIYSDVSINKDGSEIKEVSFKKNDFVKDLLKNNNFSYFSVEIDGNYSAYVSLEEDKKVSGELCYVYDDNSESHVINFSKSFDSEKFTMKDLIDFSKKELVHWKSECKNGNNKYDLEQYEDLEKE